MDVFARCTCAVVPFILILGLWWRVIFFYTIFDYQRLYEMMNFIDNVYFLSFSCPVTCIVDDYAFWFCQMTSYIIVYYWICTCVLSMMWIGCVRFNINKLIHVIQHHGTLKRCNMFWMVVCIWVIASAMLSIDVIIYLFKKNIFWVPWQCITPIFKNINYIPINQYP